jgi:hypothetical protein
MLKRFRRVGRSTTVESLGNCIFVPLVGEQGWSDEGLAAGVH